MEEGSHSVSQSPRDCSNFHRSHWYGVHKYVESNRQKKSSSLLPAFDKLLKDEEINNAFPGFEPAMRKDHHMPRAVPSRHPCMLMIPTLHLAALGP